MTVEKPLLRAHSLAPDEHKVGSYDELAQLAASNGHWRTHAQNSTPGRQEQTKPTSVGRVGELYYLGKLIWITAHRSNAKEKLIIRADCHFFSEGMSKPSGEPPQAKSRLARNGASPAATVRPDLFIHLRQEIDAETALQMVPASLQLAQPLRCSCPWVPPEETAAAFVWWSKACQQTCLYISDDRATLRL